MTTLCLCDWVETMADREMRIRSTVAAAVLTDNRAASTPTVKLSQLCEPPLRPRAILPIINPEYIS